MLVTARLFKEIIEHDNQPTWLRNLPVDIFALYLNRDFPVDNFAMYLN